MSERLFFWLTPWEPSFTFVAVLALTVLFYMRGSFHVAATPARHLGFGLGLFCFYAALQTQFDYYAEHEFFMHRIQHTLLHHAGPFLIALSRPGQALLAGMPMALRRAGAKALATKPVQVSLDILNNPAVAVLIFCGLILFWLVPPVHFIAMMDWRWYRVMNWSMAINGLMFWNLALNNVCLRAEFIAPAKRIAMMLTILPPQIIMGLMLFIVPQELYPVYGICGRAFGLSALADQQIGGQILWLSAGMMSVIGILKVMRREWLKLKSA